MHSKIGIKVLLNIVGKMILLWRLMLMMCSLEGKYLNLLIHFIKDTQILGLFTLTSYLMYGRQDLSYLKDKSDQYLIKS